MKREWQERLERLEAVQKSATAHFDHLPIHALVIMPQVDNDVRVILFLKTNDDAAAVVNNGFSGQFETYVVEQLECVGHGKRGEFIATFEYDSDENVQARYGGSYYGRLS